MLEHFKQCTPQENTRTKIAELQQFFDSVERCTYSENISSQANHNYGILYKRMITDLKSEINFLTNQVASKDTFLHVEIKFLRQQLE